MSNVVPITTQEIEETAEEYNNVVPFSLLKSLKESEKSKPKRKGGKVAGVDSEVYAFRNKEEIDAVVNVFNKHIDEATNDNQQQIARRNKMLFLIGINLGIRASDLRRLKWSFFFDVKPDDSIEFKKFYTLQPMKQRKSKKFVKLFFNQTVKNVISDYLECYPFENISDYLFASRKGDEPINVSSLWRIIKQAALEAGIEQNIGSHSLRKTFGYWVWHEASDKNRALVILQQIFNHSSTQVTMRYIGLLDDEIEDTFNSLNLGIDLI